MMQERCTKHCVQLFTRLRRFASGRQCDRESAPAKPQMCPDKMESEIKITVMKLVAPDKRLSTIKDKGGRTGVRHTAAKAQRRC